MNTATQNQSDLEVVPVNSRADLEAFIKLPWRLYRADPHWVPPLIGELKKVLDRGHHPFHQHAESAYFIARRQGEVVGRITATVNRLYNEFHGSAIGHFGFFESVDDVDVARVLLGTAERWHAERGMAAVQGPMNFSTNDEFTSPGILIDGFDTPPVVMMSHNPPYYQRLLEECGYGKVKDLLSYWVEGSEIPPRFMKTVARAGKAQGVKLRTLDIKHLDEEIARVKEIYNSAWERNWGFVPMTDAEFDHLAASIKPVVNPDLIALAEIGGEVIGFALTLPDLNVAFRHLNGRLFPFGWAKFLWHKRKIPHTRVLTLGVKPEHRQKGIDALLIMQIYVEAGRIGAPRGECSWILEDNIPMRRGIERVGGHVYKTYRVYEKQIAVGT